MIKIDSQLIMKLIPHRDPFLFVDNGEIIESGNKGIGYKKFLNTEYFFKGHFPNMPIVPGVVLIEALAQTAGIVVSYEFINNKNKTVLFMSVSKAKFRKPVLPNDEIIFNEDIIEFINNKSKSVLFMSVSKAKFRRPVKPNDKIKFEVSLLNKVRSVYKFQGTAFNQNNIKVCESEFTAMITNDSKVII